MPGCFNRASRGDCDRLGAVSRTRMRRSCSLDWLDWLCSPASTPRTTCSSILSQRARSRLPSTRRRPVEANAAVIKQCSTSVPDAARADGAQRRQAAEVSLRRAMRARHAGWQRLGVPSRGTRSSVTSTTRRARSRARAVESARHRRLDRSRRRTASRRVLRPADLSASMGRPASRSPRRPRGDRRRHRRGRRDGKAPESWRATRGARRSLHRGRRAVRRGRARHEPARPGRDELARASGHATPFARGGVSDGPMPADHHPGPAVGCSGCRLRRRLRIGSSRWAGGPGKQRRRDIRHGDRRGDIVVIDVEGRSMQPSPSRA